MSNLNTQISYYLRIAIDINKKIGGTKAYQAEQKSKDKFSVLRDTILRDFHELRNMIQTKQRFNNGFNTDQDEIKEKLRGINSQMIRMKASVEGGQGGTNNTKMLKLQIIQKLQDQYRVYDQLVNGSQFGGDETERGLLMGQKKKHKKKQPQTLTDMRAKLLDEDSVGQEDDKKRRAERNKNKGDPTQIQMRKMAEWEKQNEEIDNQVDKIIQKTQNLKAGVDRTGKLLNETEVKVKELTTDVDKVSNQLQFANKKLKGVVEKFRKPHKFCVDIILTVILIGLIIGIIKVSSD